MTHTDCPACTAMRGVVQCNRCRAERPNRRTLKQREIVAVLMANPGMSVAEAEAACGTSAGPTV
jgi:hypothetical protein